MSLRIVDLAAGDEPAVRAAAALLVEGFREHAPEAWPTLESALEEVRDSFGPDRLSLVARAEDGTVLGWIAGQRHYDGHVWELHPLVVHPHYRLRGIGRALVAELEARVAARSGITLWLGADDEDGRTSLFGVDLYPDPLTHLARLRNLRGHPFEFYRKLGFAVAGVVPDANGPGKPDILMAKRVGNRPDRFPETCQVSRGTRGVQPS
jgi:aminoglycoside 6'-N-acetyltransferase I